MTTTLRDFTLKLTGDHYPSEKYLRYITKAFHRAPHLESVTIYLGLNHAFSCKRVNANWVVCDEDVSRRLESMLASFRTVSCLFTIYS
jgi:hypothetical protein